LFDFLLLDRPLVYLLPDLAEFNRTKGFAFSDKSVGMFMPGDKVDNFAAFLNALAEAFEKPEKYREDRAFVLRYRFDFTDGESAERVYKAIMDYRPLPALPVAQEKRLLPSAASHIIEARRPHLPKGHLLIDATDTIARQEELKRLCEAAELVFYLTEESETELNDEFRSLKNHVTEADDLGFYRYVKGLPQAKIVEVTGGVDFALFSPTALKNAAAPPPEKITVGYAGIIDNERIAFGMVQYLCEAFPAYDFVFAGDIVGDYPAWLDNHANLRYAGQLAYAELPELISTFDLALLPFYGRFKSKIPAELFQYLACGKMVVTSAMPHLPECGAVFCSASLTDSVAMVGAALAARREQGRIEDALRVAKEYDWGNKNWL
jgi:glycosyltransferase involved in cell wall biosynthesis